MTIRTTIIFAAGALLALGGGAGTSHLAASASAAPAGGGGDIRIVGSSTVYPFSTKVAQEFKNKTGDNVVVESTGSGGGHKLFCEGAGPDTPDVTNSSRRQKKSEFDKCARNGVTDIVEVKIGFDGIVIAHSLVGADLNLTLKQIYLAFAKQVPVSDSDCTLQANPYTKWSDIDPSLPNETIEAYGPPPTSGTRDAFVEIAMDGGAEQIACLAEMRTADKTAFTRVARTLREDGRWIDAGENDNVIVKTLMNTPSAIGIFGYSYLEENADKLKGARVDGDEPTFENISAGAYPISRSLYFYIKKAHVGVTKGLKDYALEFTSEEAWGPGGYLEEIGLIPLPDDMRAEYRAKVENMTTYQQ